MANITFDAALIKKAERWLFLLVGLSVAATLVGVYLTGKKSIVEHLQDFPTAAVGWLLLATVVESILRFWRYHTAGKALGLNVPFWRMMYYYTVGYALIPTPGKVGTAIRLWMLKQHHNLPYGRTAPLLVMDLISDAIAMCGLGALSLAVLGTPALKGLGWVVLIALVVGITMTLVTPHVFQGLVGVFYRLGGKRKPRLFAKIRKIIRATSKVLGWQLLLITTAQSFVGWALVGAAVGYLLTALGTPMGIAEGSATVALGTMGGFLSMMPAGVGGAEAAMGFLLYQFGTSTSTALLAVILIRLCVTWSAVAIGLVLLPYALRSKK